MMMVICRFISSNKCITEVQDINSGAALPVLGWGYMGTLYFLLHFPVYLRLLSKIKFINFFIEGLLRNAMLYLKKKFLMKKIQEQSNLVWMIFKDVRGG